jgi:hypothetical protein
MSRAVVLLLAFAAAVSSGLDIRLSTSKVGTFGFTAAFDGKVTRVMPGGAASDGGIYVGQQIDVERTKPQFRRYLLDVGYVDMLAPKATFIVRDSPTTTHEVTLQPRLAAFPFPDNVASFLFGLAYLALIFTGTALFLRKPSWLTFTFYCYSVATSSWSWLLSADLRWPVYLPWADVEACLYVLNWFPLTLFALAFPRGTIDGWRARASNVAAIAFIVLAPVSIYAVLEYWTRPLNPLTQLVYYEPLLGLFIAFAITFVNFVHSQGIERKLLGIVVAALLIGNFCTDASTVLTFSSQVPALDIWFINVLAAGNIAVPIAVAFAILRYRLFGIYASRALLFSILTGSIFVAKYGLERFLERPIAEVLGDFALALSILVSFGLAQRPLERWIEARLFRKRRQARRSLKAIGAQVARDANEHGATDLAVHKTVSYLDLTCAALFRCHEGGFTRYAASGWPVGAPDALEPGNPILEAIRQTLRPVKDKQATQGWAPFSKGTHGPVVAIPVLVRGELCAIALYGSHEASAVLDEYDFKTLRSICRYVGLAYDRSKTEAEHKTIQEVLNLLARLKDDLSR